MWRMSDQLTVTPVVLEPAAQAFAEATANPPFLFELAPGGGPQNRRRRAEQRHRKARHRRASGSPSPAGRPARSRRGSSARAARPARCPSSSTSTAPAGCSATRTPTTDSSASSPSAPARPSSSPSTASRPRPATRSRSSRTTRSRGGSSTKAPPRTWTPRRIAIAGDSVGGNMAAALTLHGQGARRARARGPGAVLPGHRRELRHRLLPRSSPRATSCAATRCSGSGTSTRPTRRSATRSPPRRCARPPSSSPGCRRRSSSPARRTSYATRARRTRNKLREAGVDVTADRYEGIIHDFVMLNALRETNAAGAAINQAIAFLGARLGA